MLKRWQEFGLLDLIKDAYERGVIICGLSTGAICWFEDIYTDDIVNKIYEQTLPIQICDKKLFLFDMDGTLYLDDDLYPATIPFLTAVKENGGKAIFLTNNSSKSTDAYVNGLLPRLSSRSCYKTCS